MTAQEQTLQQADVASAFTISFLNSDPYWRSVAREFASGVVSRIEAQQEFASRLHAEMLDSPIAKGTYYGFLLFDALQKVDWQRVAKAMLAKAERTAQAA